MLRGHLCANNKPYASHFQDRTSHPNFYHLIYSAGLTGQTYFIRNLANPSIKYNLSAESERRLIERGAMRVYLFYFL